MSTDNIRFVGLSGGQSAEPVLLDYQREQRARIAIVKQVMLKSLTLTDISLTLKGRSDK